MPLNATQIKQAKPKDKTYTLADGHGLFLEITPNGSNLNPWTVADKTVRSKF